jgi:hypothetical protein
VYVASFSFWCIGGGSVFLFTLNNYHYDFLYFCLGYHTEICHLSTDVTVTDLIPQCPLELAGTLFKFSCNQKVLGDDKALLNPMVVTQCAVDK